MECIRFCSVTMPIRRWSSTTGMMLELRAVSLRKAEPSESWRTSNFENLVHHGLHVAVALGPQGIENALLRNHSHHIAAANHGEIILQRVDSFFQRIF